MIRFEFRLLEGAVEAPEVGYSGRCRACKRQWSYSAIEKKHVKGDPL